MNGQFQSELERKISDFRELGLPAYTRREKSAAFVPRCVSVISGARRAGKSFFAFQTADDWIADGFAASIKHVCHLDFDNPVLGAAAADDLPSIPTVFLKASPAFNLKTKLVFIFDEIHRVKGWEDFVIDLSRNPNWRVVVTGSSAKSLGREMATALRGKAVTTALTPLSFREFLAFKGLAPDGAGTRWTASVRGAFDEYLRWGAFPVVPSVQERVKPVLLREYYATMLLRDIIERNSVRNADDVIALYGYLMACNARPVTVKSAKEQLERAGRKSGREAIAEAIGFAKDAWMLSEISIHTDSVAQRERNYRKFYAVDWALAQQNSAVWDGSLSRSFENLVYSELSRRHARVCYALTKSTRQEVDFVADDARGRPVAAAQVSLDISAAATRERELAPLASVASYYGIREPLLVTLNDERTVEQDGTRIRVVPAWKWLLEG